jgi:hypothetical protein
VDYQEIHLKHTWNNDPFVIPPTKIPKIPKKLKHLASSSGLSMCLKTYKYMFNLSFFKRLGFTTKKDGEAIFTNKEVQKEVLRIDSELQFFQLTKQDQLFNFIQSNFKDELSDCLGKEKINIANRKKDKVLLQKQQMKRELIEEINQDKIVSEFPDLVVVNDIGDLKKKFFNALVILAEQKLMTPDIYNEFLLMKANYEACFEILYKINSFLDTVIIPQK